MSYLINRQTVIDAVHEELDECLIWDESGEFTANEVERIIYTLPSIQPEREKGMWDSIGYQQFRCTRCFAEYTQKQLEGMKAYLSDSIFPNYCPECGADMRGEQNDS